MALILFDNERLGRYETSVGGQLFLAGLREYYANARDGRGPSRQFAVALA